MLTYVYRLCWFIARCWHEKDDMYISQSHMSEILRDKGKQ